MSANSLRSQGTPCPCQLESFGEDANKDRKEPITMFFKGLRDKGSRRECFFLRREKTSLGP